MFGLQKSRRARPRGYTLLELIVVMAIISILVSIAVPIYQKSLIRSKESLLKNQLFTLHTVIDQYDYDQQKAPQTLDDLVTKGYLRSVPVDPITGNDQWQLIMEDSARMVDPTQPGISEVRSLSTKMSLEGTRYSDWR
jgi:general secretion pathway protein G